MDLVFARELSFYIVTIYIPCFMIVVVSWFSFWLDYKAVSLALILSITNMVISLCRRHTVATAIVVTVIEVVVVAVVIVTIVVIVVVYLDLLETFLISNVLPIPEKNISLAVRGALAYCLQWHTAQNTPPPAKSKMATRGPKMADWVGKEVQP